MSPRLPGQKPKPAPKRFVEPGQHRWSALGATYQLETGGVLKPYLWCSWEMLSRPNSNRYRSGPGRPWQHTPLPCRGMS